MLPKVAATAAYAIAALTIVGGYTQLSAVRLHQRQQLFYDERENPDWRSSPNRRYYNNFRGRGIGAGK